MFFFSWWGNISSEKWKKLTLATSYKVVESRTQIHKPTEPTFHDLSNTHIYIWALILRAQVVGDPPSGSPLGEFQRSRWIGTEERRLKRWTSMAGSSLVVQWLRIHLPMQGTQVQSLAWEDRTCCGATNLCSETTEAHAFRAHALQQEQPPQWEAWAPQQRPNMTKNKYFLNISKK